ncbi:MAG: HAMP domain-containing sensor histidine kinase [Chthoniobacteraceae bacterium]
MLPRSLVFAADAVGGGEGWVNSESGPFAVYWRRREDDTVIAVLLDQQRIRAVANAHLLRWSSARFAGAAAAKGLDRLESQDGMLLTGLAETPERPPDFVIPFVTRFGDWQIKSWDRLELRTAYRPAPLVAALGCSGLLFLIGVSLARQQSRSQRLAEQRVSFVNQVSHELGTPLTNALLNLDLAAEQMAIQPERARRRLALVIEDLQRLARLVGNVLTFSRGERRTLEMRPGACIADEVIDDVLAQFAPSLERRGISVERVRCGAEPIVVDRDALAQIIGNLISNVEKYAANGKWLGLETRLESDALVVRVSDRGAGVPAADRVRIFEAFERVSNRLEEGASGAGLGLTIARDLADRMGGALALESSDTGGSTFVLRVPAARVVIAMPADRSAA